MSGEPVMTTADMADLCMVTPETINGWVLKGLVEPAERGGRGRGKGYRFSLAQGVAVFYAMNLRELKCGLDYVRGAIEMITGMGDDGLKAAIDSGVRVVLPGMPLTPPPKGIEVPSLLDLAEVYRTVKQRYDDLRKVREEHAESAKAKK